MLQKSLHIAQSRIQPDEPEYALLSRIRVRLTQSFFGIKEKHRNFTS